MKFIGKKFILPLIIAAGCLTFSACSGGGSSDSGSDEDGTEGLEYTLGDDGTYICSGIGTAESEYIKIAQAYSGISVTAIGASAFYGGEFKEITIPENISSIGRGAFATCNYITEITLPEAVTVINESALYGCASLKKITLGESVESIGAMAFKYCVALTQINLPDTVNHIGAMAFSDCEELPSVILPESLTRIENKTFYGCSSLTEIFIPESVTEIGDSAFYDCSALSRIYYDGDENDWNNIEIGKYNGLTTDMIYYYSEGQPAADTGNYWHYNGDSIEIWQ